MKTTCKLLRSLATLAVAGLFPIAASAADVTVPTPLLEFLFNDIGTTTANTGSSSSILASGTMKNPAGNGIATDLHGTANSGLTGVAGDRAFDNTASAAMGSTGGGANRGGGVSLGDTSAVTGALTSFTITGWFKSDTAIKNGAHLVSNHSGSSGFRLKASDSETGGNLQLFVNGTAVAAGLNAWNATDEWVFFAVTYDGTTTTNNVKFYVGSAANDSVALKSTQSLSPVAGGTVVASAADFTIGEFSGTVANRPYDGLLDNIRLYGVTSGAVGALSIQQIQAIHAGDLTVVPEPSHAIAVFALISLGGAFLVRRMKR